MPFYSWFDIYSTIRLEDVHSVPLWHNKYIQIDSKPVYYKECDEKGIKCFRDILDDKNNILSRTDLERKINSAIRQMSYNSIISAIPSEWKSSAKIFPQKQITDQVNIIIEQKNVQLNDIKCKDFYWQFIDQIAIEPKSESKWVEHLNLNIEKNEWTHYCSNSVIQ